MAAKGVLAFFLASAVLLCAHPARGQAGDELKPELQDPVWMQLLGVMHQFESFHAETITRTRCDALFSIAAYDALASYSENMDGLVVGGTLRRPASERTLDNKRTAVVYAIYRTIMAGGFPGGTQTLDGAASLLRIDPNLTTTDPTTPEGLGNLIAEKIIASPYFDAFEGTQPIQRNHRWGKRGRRMISHWTRYVPKNTAYRLKYLTKWQPLEVKINSEYAVVQVFVADIYSDKPMITGYHPSYFKCPKPTMMLNAKSPGYKAQADRVLEISANLNDTFKMKAEGVDGAFGDDGFNFLVNKHKWGFEKQIIWNFVFAMCVRESQIVSAFYKHVYDTIRPVSLIALSGLYDTVTAWGGPGKGTVTMKAINFRQYNERTDPSPEYPSGACTYYGTYSTVAEKFTGKEFGWVATFEAGSSRREPGITPAETLSIHFPTFADQKRIGKEGREAGGVHFQIAVDEGISLGEAIAEKLYEKLCSLFKFQKM